MREKNILRREKVNSVQKCLRVLKFSDHDIENELSRNTKREFECGKPNTKAPKLQRKNLL